MASPRRIDVHFHHIPPFYSEAVYEAGRGPAIGLAEYPRMNNAAAHPSARLEARIDLDAKNTKLAYGADRSSKMDFSEYDKIDDFELNEILWHAVKGPDAPMPPAVRRAIASIWAMASLFRSSDAESGNWMLQMIRPWSCCGTKPVGAAWKTHPVSTSRPP